jgi:DNA-binding transcriptional regulator YdaS (Cro superfamily)
MSAFREYLDARHGRGVEIARAIGVTPGAVTQWAETQVPAERIFRLAALTGIPVEQLRPDLFEGLADASR